MSLIAVHILHIRGVDDDGVQYHEGRSDARRLRSARVPPDDAVGESSEARKTDGRVMEGVLQKNWGHTMNSSVVLRSSV